MVVTPDAVAEDVGGVGAGYLRTAHPKHISVSGRLHAEIGGKGLVACNGPRKGSIAGNNLVPAVLPIEELIAAFGRSTDSDFRAFLNSIAGHAGYRSHNIIIGLNRDTIGRNNHVCLEESIQSGVLGNDEGIRVLGHAVGPAKEVITALWSRSNGMRNAFIN